MTSYYNEIDPYAAQWLRNLIEAKLIAPGHVDTRSIVDVRHADLAGFTQCHFFAGLGGWAGALRLADFPDDRPVWTGSCPCQPFSLAGKQKGFDDERHLWPIWRRLIAERRPAKVYGEQVASASQWLGLVRGDMEALDYAVGAIPCEAASAGADHLRDRFWFVGNLGDAEHGRCEGRQSKWSGADTALPSGQANSCNVGDTGSSGTGRHCGSLAATEAEISGQGQEPRHISNEPFISDTAALNWVIGADGKARRVKSGIRLLAHGIPARVAKLRALGNAIDLRPAATFIKATM